MFLYHLDLDKINVIYFFEKKYLNRFLRERGMAVQPQNGIPGFSLHFQKEISYGYLRFEGNGKIPLGR